MSAEGEPTTESAGHPRRWRALWGTASLYAAVVAGGIVGSLARWVVALVIPAHAGGLPWPTFFANVTGCFVIGFYAALTGPDGRLFAGARTRQFVMTGICGGYTTFSGFALETVRFILSNDVRSALYLVLSLASWLSAVWLGDALAEWINN
ncbi:MAG: CrcB family protein [Reyranella sp.]|uniref:CrcB family protein n=1 Tax=Reyranella sp. TaxID=1929291 RepID=UPI001AD4C694|nr:CrcB family protein [Reyranella sp.]MBN9085969.1 CrcB family protein [Reyranella sp.]